MTSKFQKQFVKERVTQLIRDYFISRSFHEVETPTILPQIPLEPNLYALKTTWAHRFLDFYLATSPESSLKKLIAEGLGNCFAISKVFRDLEDIGSTHNLEFSMLEWYEMGFDYHHLAQTTENLILTLFHGINNKNNNRVNNILNYQNYRIDLTPPWHRFTLQELFQKFANLDLSQNLTTSQLLTTAATKGYSTDGITTWEPLYTQIFVNEIEPRLPTDKPSFIFDYPTSLSPLCKPCPDSPGFSQRFEFYIGGMEIGNGYTELTDASILEKNFQAEAEFRAQNHLPTHPYDQKLIEATKTFPDCTGIGLGVDRLGMLFANAAHINEVLYFPTSQLIE
jgi:elongation factor P--beta-lysine ligase